MAGKVCIVWEDTVQRALTKQNTEDPLIPLSSFAAQFHEYLFLRTAEL